MAPPSEFRRARARLLSRVAAAGFLAVVPPAAAGGLCTWAAARCLGRDELLPLLAGAAIVGFLDGRRVSFDVRAIDRRLSLAGRLVTAREVAARRGPLAAEGLLLRDAARRLASPKVSSFLPAGAGPATRASLLAAAALLALGPRETPGDVPRRPGAGTPLPVAGLGPEPAAPERPTPGGPTAAEPPRPARPEPEGAATASLPEAPAASEAARHPRLVPIEPLAGPTAEKEAYVFEFPDTLAAGREDVRRVPLEEAIDSAAEQARAWARRANLLPAEREFVGAYFDALRP